jgi:LmbE family N-acetylglucosaminyl deacetylase
MPDRALRLLIIGAHPDDADYHAGGTAALYRAAGNIVKMVSLTNGDAGHQSLRGSELALRRKAEAAAAGAVIGAEYEVFDNHDGELLPTLENRHAVIKLVRSFKPDVVFTHRPNDYHPDHRYTSLLVQDAGYMITVPAILPGVPHLASNPVIAYVADDFQKPLPFQPDVIVDVGAVVESIVEMLHCHQSQFYEWLPFNRRILDLVPQAEAERRDWLGAQVKARLKKRADQFNSVLATHFGPEKASRISYVEAFEICEYGAPLDEESRRRLFPSYSA